MAWNGLGMKWELAAQLGDVGWVYILTLQKLAIITNRLGTSMARSLSVNGRNHRGSFG